MPELKRPGFDEEYTSTRAARTNGRSKRHSVVQSSTDAGDTPRSADGAALPDVLTVPEAAAYLRMNAKTIRAMFHDGDLRGKQRGKLIRISAASVVEWAHGVRLHDRSAS